MNYFEDFVCVLQMIHLTKLKQMILVLGLHRKERNSTRDKSNIGNPKINKGCAPLTANRTWADCEESFFGPSIKYIPLRVYHIGGFHAMYLSDYIIGNRNITRFSIYKRSNPVKFDMLTLIIAKNSMYILWDILYVPYLTVHCILLYIKLKDKIAYTYHSFILDTVWYYIPTPVMYNFPSGANGPVLHGYERMLDLYVRSITVFMYSILLVLLRTSHTRIIINHFMGNMLWIWSMSQLTIKVLF